MEADDIAEENRRLRRTMRDLVALSSLPAVWSGLPIDGIARSLADVLVSTLSLDLVYIRIVAANGAIAEVARTPDRSRTVDVRVTRDLLEETIASDGSLPPIVLPGFEGPLRLSVTRFGIGGELGVVVSGSRDPSFPTERHRLLLAVGANQTAILLERRRADDETHEQRERLQVTLASIGDAVLVTDTQGRVTFLNPIAESLTGWTSAEALGRPIEEVFEIIDEGTRARTDNPVGQVLREGRLVALANHTVLIARDRTERPIDESAAPIRGRDGEIVGCVLVFRDISEKKRADAEIRHAGELFRAMADNIPQLSWMARPDGGVFWFNRRWYEYTGTTFEQVEGSGWHSVVGPDELPAVRARFLCQIQRGEPWEDTFALRRHDGELRWHLSRAMPIKDEHGVVIRWFGSNTDVTDQRKMAADLAEADRRKNEFLATLAHELRNPLAPIRTGLHVLQLSPKDPAIVENAHHMMERQLGQMVRLVDDLMDVSRITSGKINLRKDCTQMATVIHSAVETSQPLIEKMGHTLTVCLPAEPVAVQADLTRLAQVFMNLLNNAAKYTERGGHITLKVEQQGTDVIVSVKDTGIGISAQHLPAIFDMFSQVDRSVDKAQGGLGIGLTLVKRLVEMHGGSVEAKSAGLNLGSEFIVRLPVAVSAQGASVESAIEARTSKTTLRVLIVDDNRDSADILAMMMTYAGHEVRIAYDGEEAIAAAAAFQPDVILLDLGLPKVSGYEACRRIRAQRGGDLPIIVAQTGWGQAEDRARTREAGFDHHMVKPLDPVKLRALLAELSPRAPR